MFPLVSFLWFVIPIGLVLWVSLKSKIPLIQVIILSALPSLLYSSFYNMYGWVTHMLDGTIFESKCINAFIMPYFMLFPLFALSSIFVLYWKKAYHPSFYKLLFIGGGIGIAGMLLVALFIYKDMKTMIQMAIFGASFGALSVSILYWFTNDSKELCDDI